MSRVWIEIRITGWDLVTVLVSWVVASFLRGFLGAIWKYYRDRK